MLTLVVPLSSSPLPRTLSRIEQFARLFPSSLLVARGNDRRHAVALTFDAGPHPVHTPRILDILREYGAHATFFAIGEAAAEHPCLVRRIASEGHTLACHTQTHCDLSRLGLRAAWRECRQERDTLEQIAGRRVAYLRLPLGKIGISTLGVVPANRMRLVLWSLDSLDHQGWSPQQMVEHLHDVAPEPGEILRFHASYARTAAALPQILDLLCRCEFACVNLDTMLAPRPRLKSNAV
jgi:peptidoglycan/xylan/chitin deacetylase (PgdA/CDA1 family)